MQREATDQWLRAAFRSWLGQLDDDQLDALVDNWENVMNDAALDRIDSWVVAGNVLEELRKRKQ